MQRLIVAIFLGLTICVCPALGAGSLDEDPAVLLSDDFSGLEPGMFSSDVVGAHANITIWRPLLPRAAGRSPASRATNPSGPGE